MPNPREPFAEDRVPVPLSVRGRVERRLARRLTSLAPTTKRLMTGGRRRRVGDDVLDLDVQTVLWLQKVTKEPPFGGGDVGVARRAMLRQSLLAAGRPPATGRVRDIVLQGAAGPIGGRHYAPAPGDVGPALGGGDRRPAPLLVYFHGGGWVVGDLDTHDALCRELAAHVGAHVLAVDYRLAPEHPFPAPVDDALAAWSWAVEHAVDLGADPSRIAVAGDSAGGNLAAVVTQETARRGERAPDAQLLFYPGVDAVGESESRRRFAEGFFLTSDMIDWFADHYMGAEGAPGAADRADVRLSPILAPPAELEGLAPAIVVTAAFDPLRDQGEAYARRLADAGVPVVARRYEGLIHGFANMSGLSRASHEALVECAGALRAQLAAVPKGRPRVAADGSRAGVA